MDALTFPIPSRYSDDIILALGTNKDIALVERSTSLAANTALTNVLIGTPVTHAITAKSLILSDVTASGSLLFAANRGGNSEEYLNVDSANGILYLAGFLGGVGLGLAGGMPAPDNAAVHIWNATAGTVTANANSQLIVEGGGATEITILSPDNALSGLTWGDPTNASHGQILYGGPTASVASSFRIFAATSEVLRLSATTLAFQAAFTINTIAASNLTINPLTTGALILQSGGTEFLRLNNTGVGFFAVAPVARQASGANLTNNVTAGGTNDTIANYTDLVTYGNDAAAIRNDIYQLARQLKQVNDALRLYGLLT